MHINKKREINIGTTEEKGSWGRGTPVLCALNTYTGTIRSCQGEQYEREIGSHLFLNDFGG
jgi:hypothetical protein